MAWPVISSNHLPAIKATQQIDLVTRGAGVDSQGPFECRPAVVAIELQADLYQDRHGSPVGPIRAPGAGLVVGVGAAITEAAFAHVIEQYFRIAQRLGIATVGRPVRKTPFQLP